MQVQTQPFCGSSADLPFLEGSSQHQGVLRKHCAEQSYKSHNSTAPPQLEQRGILSPSENAYTQRCVTTGTYYTGNVHTQHVGLVGFVIERSEKQITCELGRLYELLQRSERYQEYREKQPALTPAEVIARDAAERKEQERRKAEGLQQEKDKAVWPDFIEHAFWTALVRWPPIGRKKYMLEGTQRGRNELIQDSIYRDTGIKRDRKQISSHIQVLNSKLRAVPAVLLYMATPEDITKRRCASTPVRTCHSPHMRGRQHAQRTDSVAKYEYNTPSPHVWPHRGGPQQDLALSSGPDSGSLSSLFTVTDLSIVVDGDDQPVHSNGELDGSVIADLASWRHQYRGFNLPRSETDEWMRSSRKVLVCTASIKVTAEVRSNADLTIAFGLYSHIDFSRYNYVEPRTRFYDDEKGAVDPELDSINSDQQEQRTSCEYRPDLHRSTGVLRVKFDSAFFLARMRQYQSMGGRNDRSVWDPLHRLTIVQDIYGIVPGTGKAHCLCTVLWRFQQAKNSAEVSSMKWRSISFAKSRLAAEERWCHEADDQTEGLGDVEVGHEQITNAPTSTPTDVTPYHQASPLPVDLVQTHTPYHSFEVDSHHVRHPPPLSIDTLGSMRPDLDHFDGSAATTTTEFSQRSFALPKKQGTLSLNAHDNHFGYNGGHMTTTGIFGSTINIPTYESFPSQNAGTECLHSLAGVEHDDFAAMRLSIGEHGQLVPVNANDLHTSTNLACYSTKTNWQHAHLISHLENATKQYHSYIGPCDHAQLTENHENLHGHDVYQQTNQTEESVATGLHHVYANANHSLWGLKGLRGPFEESTDSTVASGINYDKEQAQGSEFGVSDLIESDHRGRRYQT